MVGRRACWKERTLAALTDLKLAAQQVERWAELMVDRLVYLKEPLLAGYWAEQ